MSPPPPKRPPRSPRPPGEPASRPEAEPDLPFDEDEVAPLQADDPRPQRVTQYPAGARRRSRRGGSSEAREGRDRELPARFSSGEYEDAGHVTAFLYVERGPGAGQLLPIKQGTLVLGRASTSDLRLQHPSISRRHAQLTRRGDHITLKDLGSQNGTYVNRNRVQQELELLAGDEVSLGNALLRIRGPGFVPERAPSEDSSAGLAPRGSMAPRRWVVRLSVLVGSLLGVLLALVSVRHLHSKGRVPAPRAETPHVTEPVQEARPAPTAEPAPDLEVPPTRAPDTDPEPASTSSTSPKGSAPSAEAISGSPRPSTSKGKPVRTHSGSPARTPSGQPAHGPDSEAEAEALAQYEAGELDAALTLARKAHLDALGSRISHFKDEWRAGNSALAERDFASASQHLTLASQLDQQLSGGWSTFAPKLRAALQKAEESQAGADSRPR